jgi:dipeptidyl aminopeptidase/acylaminoacyl peptidase
MIKSFKSTLALACALSAIAVPALAQDKAEAVVKATQPERFPIWTFGVSSFLNGPRISPDGTKIVVQFAKDGSGAIGIIDLDNLKAPTQFITSTTEVRDVGDRDIYSWRWVGPNNVILYLQSRENIFGQRGDVTRLTAYNLTTKKITPLAWAGAAFSAADILHVDHSKETILLQRTSNASGTERFNNPEVVLVDVKTGKFTTEVRTNPIVGGWFADSSGVVRGGFGGNSNSGDTGKGRLLYRSKSGDVFKTVQNEADKDFTDDVVTPVDIEPGTDDGIGYSNKSGVRKLYKMNMKTMQIGDLVFEKAGYDVEAGAFRSADNKKIIGYSVNEKRRRFYWVDSDWKVIQQLMDEQFGKGNAFMVSRDLKDERIIFIVAKPNQAGGYYLFDTKTGKLNNIGWTSSIYKDAELNPMKTIVYDARDGTKIPAVVTFPRHRLNQKNLPVVILPHGGPFGVRDDESFTTEASWHQALAEQGYVVIKPNYRGSGGYGKEFVMKGRKPDGYGKKMQDDLNDALTWFAKDGMIDPKRACVMGWSYGGYAAARGAQRDPGVWKCAVAGAGVYDMPMMNKWDRDNLSNFSSKFQATSDDPIGISSARNTDGKWAPILIVAGVRDQRIPIEQSRTLVSRLKSSGKKEGVDFKYVEQPLGTHHLPYDYQHVQWLEEAEAWIEKHNPAFIASDGDKPAPLVDAAKLGPKPTVGKEVKK